jgi:glycine/D-amino acid oxidase-like deaminating enzyme
MDRRRLLQIAGAGAASGFLARPGFAQTPVTPSPLRTPALLPIRLTPDEIVRTTVCLRPFRAAGPRIETEVIGRKIVVHNYGHGGSGWSLSWGSADAAVKLAMQSGPKHIAIIGAGALGLTAALTAQRAGAKVTIYAKERFPHVRSARATGTWTPDSRVAKLDAVTPDFADKWEQMARLSYGIHQSYVSLPGAPVEWIDQYVLRDEPPPATPNLAPADDAGFIRLYRRLNDIQPHQQPVAPGGHPFAATYVTRGTVLSFNVASLAHQLTEDFLIAGGTFVPAELHTPADFGKLKEKVIINCTGYGARALCKDESIIPVRGQIVWLPPQEGVHYAFRQPEPAISVVARRDGIVVQALGEDELFGWNDDNEIIDPEAARASILALQHVYATT